jgi:Transposase DDE domain
MRIVLGPRPKQRRRRRSAADYQRQRAMEPWLLATNLENEAAQSIVRIYAQRMQIEECFRDAKCPRFGWALKFALTKSHARMNVLLMLLSIALSCSAPLPWSSAGRSPSRELTAPARAVGVHGRQHRRQKPPSEPNSPTNGLQATRGSAPRQSSSLPSADPTSLPEP